MSSWRAVLSSSIETVSLPLSLGTMISGDSGSRVSVVAPSTISAV